MLKTNQTLELKGVKLSIYQQNGRNSFALKMFFNISTRKINFTDKNLAHLDNWRENKHYYDKRKFN